ncbi:MAG: alpha/beta hydrolase [Pseudomonadota bacterium]
MHLFLPRHLAILVLLAVHIYGTACYAVQQSSSLEQSICGLKESFVFWLWSSAAGKPGAARLAQVSNVEDVAITSSDGRILHGYKLTPPHTRNGKDIPKGYLLVAQGNAMLADQIITHFNQFAGLGYDVYIFDYRGYGRSEGKRRLKAILNDYHQIIQQLNTQPYQNRAFYGMSFGGVVLLDALRNQTGEMTVVIDSTPSRLSDYGCPAAHDPVNNLPRDTGNLLVIAGAKDQVVKPGASSELLELAEDRGATVLRPPTWGHPFMDSHTQRRLETVRRFLLHE